MKQRKIGQETVNVYRQQCDGCSQDFPSHPYNECYKEKTAQVIFEFGYFSSRDGFHGQYNFCQDCAEDIYKSLTKTFPNLEPLHDIYS